MKSKHTTGKWVYNSDSNAIESDSEWFIEPNPEWELEGSKISVISTYGAMGGNDVIADIKLICAAPDLLNALKEMILFAEFHGYTSSTEINNAKKVLEEALS